MSAETIEGLQTQIAYQDDAIEQLSATVYAQAREIDRLAEQAARLERHLQSLLDQRDGANDDATPPHY